MNSNLRIVGLLGGVASGKSLVAEQLAALGAEVLDADKAGHAVLRQEEVKEQIYRRWGDSVFHPEEASNLTAYPTQAKPFHTTHEVDRAALARIVFNANPEGRADLAELEKITHPRIRLLLEEQLAAMRERQVPVAVLDAALMVKAGWHKLCDVIMFIDAPLKDRLQRAKTRGWSESEFHRREAAQESLSDKKSFADVVLDNSGTPAELQQQVVRWWQEQFPTIA